MGEVERVYYTGGGHASHFIFVSWLLLDCVLNGTLCNICILWIPVTICWMSLSHKSIPMNFKFKILLLLILFVMSLNLINVKYLMYYNCYPHNKVQSLTITQKHNSMKFIRKKLELEMQCFNTLTYMISPISNFHPYWNIICWWHFIFSTYFC
jgi:hypothetical protein